MGVLNMRTFGHDAGLLDEGLDLVVAAHLRAVQHHRAHDVRVQASVETLQACFESANQMTAFTTRGANKGLG